MLTKLFKINFAIACLVCLATASRAQTVAPAAWQVTNYDLTVTLPAQSAAQPQPIQVRATINARNVGGAGRTFTARVAPEAEINTVTIGGQPTTFEKGTDAIAKLQQARVRLPEAIPPGGNLSITFDYRLPLERNSGIAAFSAEGAQFLPLSAWYPTPNTQFAPLGADTAPFRLTIKGATPDIVAVSGGTASGDAGNRVFQQALYSQPFFVAGRWTMIEGAGATPNISAYLYEGASEEERARAAELIKFTAAARAYLNEIFGGTTDIPLRLVAVRRGAGFDGGGTILLDAAAFRREKLDAATALTIAEGVARIHLGGMTPVRGEGSGAIREGLARHLALSFIERAADREAAEAERARGRAAYVSIATRDAPLARLTPAFDNYYATASVKGAAVWRLIEATMGREQFMQRLRGLFTKRGGEASLTLAAIRAALTEGTAGDDALRQLLDYSFDQPTEMDLLVGVPVPESGGQKVALRNTGAAPARVAVVAYTSGGAPLSTEALIPAKDFGEARFPATAKIMRIEIDPQKLYPQIDYDNDTAPKTASATDLFIEATQAYTRGAFAEAEIKARSALALAPRMSEARITLARALLGANRIDEAEKEFRAALADSLPLATTIAWANTGLGEILLRRGQAAEAARHFDRAVRADAEYAATLQARDGRIRAEAAARTATPIDEAARLFVQTLDAAIRSGRKAELDAVVVGGELGAFSRGIVGGQPQLWSSEVRRTEALGGTRIGVDVRVTARILGQDQAGTAVYVLTRTPAGLKLADVQLFEVR